MYLMSWLNPFLNLGLSLLVWRRCSFSDTFIMSAVISLWGGGLLSTSPDAQHTGLSSCYNFEAAMILIITQTWAVKRLNSRLLLLSFKALVNKNPTFRWCFLQKLTNLKRPTRSWTSVGPKPSWIFIQWTIVSHESIPISNLAFQAISLYWTQNWFLWVKGLDISLLKGLLCGSEARLSQFVCCCWWSHHQQATRRREKILTHH